MGHYKAKLFTPAEMAVISAKPYLSIVECSAYLSLHPQTIYNMIERGRLKSCRAGRSIRIKRSDADASMMEQTTPAEAMAKSVAMMAKKGLKVRTN